ncbi:MAG TPA: hypothetical protein VGG48_06650 [Rhizomicrobium sp.]|jgi:hypothetical protein
MGSGFVETVRRFAPSIRRLLIGFFLIAAFAATSAVLLFVITTERLQNAITAPGLANLKVSTGWIRRDVSEVEHYWTVLNVITTRQDQAQDLLYKTSIANQEDRAAMVSAADQVRTFIAVNDTLYIRPPLKVHDFPQVAASAPSSIQFDQPAEAPAGQQPAAAPAPSDGPIPAPNFGSAVYDYFDAYYDQLGSGNDEARKSLDAFKVESFKRLDKYFRAREDFDSDISKVQVVKARIAALDALTKKLNDNVAPSGSALANDDYWNLVEDFESFKSLAGDSAYDVVLLPRMMLVLVLAIFMGILGSLIYISQDFLRNPDGRGLWDILFRIGLGAGVAFALFFFAAAGMLALSQNGSGTQTDMSPYLISFLGITGGYLSDRVTQWMREVGENAFRIRADGPPDRWAVGLSEGLKASGQDITALASSIGVPAEDAQAWAALSKPVPGDKQGLIAAFLREHPSKVFTDIAPS